MNCPCLHYYRRLLRFRLVDMVFGLSMLRRAINRPRLRAAGEARSI